MATGRVPTTANSPLTAKGDLFTYSTAPARLAVGLDGEQIVADSSTATGLKWAAPSAGSSNVAGKNAVLNSNFSIWQRGTSIAGTSGSGTYTADRWSCYNASYTVSQQDTSDTTNLPFIAKCARVIRRAGETSTAGVNFVQPLESINSKPFIGKVATLSFYARAGANYSSASSGLLVFLLGGTGTDQNPNNAYTGQTSILSPTATLTTTWQRFSYTSSTIATTVNELAVQFTSLGVGTAGAADYFEVTGVQLEIASAVSDYSPNAATFQGELAACQRYYQLGAGFMAIADGTTLIKTGWSFKTTMRTSPSVSASAAFQVFYPGVDYTQSSANIAIESSRVTAEGAQLKMDNFTGLTAGRIYTHNVGNGNILLSAEL